MHGGIHLGETGLARRVGAGDLYDVVLEGSGFTVHRCPGAFLSRTPRAGAAPMPPRPAQGHGHFDSVGHACPRCKVPWRRQDITPAATTRGLVRIFSRRDEYPS